MYRYLGSGEHSLWLYSQVAPAHFAMTARVVGKFSTDQLKQALAGVQQRHPLLRMRIVPDEFGQPFFIEDSASIPLRIVQRKKEQHWQYEVEQELAQPFNWSEAPLVRVVLVHSTDVSELIVTSHHSIGDGLSSAYLLRDIVQALGTPECEQQLLPKRPSFENLIPEVIKTTAPNPLTPFPPLQTSPERRGTEEDVPPFRGDFRGGEGGVPTNSVLVYEVVSSPSRQPRLLSWSLSSQETTSLISRCRQEQTSVHAVICAAFMLAIATESEQLSTLKCLSPINIRRYLSPAIESDFGFYFWLGLTSHTLTANQSLWDIARSLKSQLNQQMLPDKIFEGIPAHQALMSTNPSPRLVYQGFVEQYNNDLLVSNLGRLNFPKQLGQLQLEAIYGPAVMGPTMEKQRVVGVATLGDKMCFTFTYPESDMSLVEAERLQKEAMQQLFCAAGKPNSNYSNFQLIEPTKALD